MQTSYMEAPKAASDSIKTWGAGEAEGATPFELIPFVARGQN